MAKPRWLLPSLFRVSDFWTGAFPDRRPGPHTEILAVDRAAGTVTYRYHP